MEKLQGLGMTSLRTRQRLVERLTEQGIKDIRILEAMRDTPRHFFLDEALASRAYDDMALPIGHQQTISQPYVVARMTELLIEGDKFNEKPLKRSLEIGTGCGYQTAILANFSKRVLSIERIKPLHERAKSTLSDLKIKNIRLLHDDGNMLSNMEGNFDAILSAAAPLRVPDYLLKKLSIGGKLVIPIGDNNFQHLTLIRRVKENEFEEKTLDKVLFVPLLKGLVS